MQVALPLRHANYQTENYEYHGTHNAEGVGIETEGNAQGGKTGERVRLLQIARNRLLY
jgi:hypothetical protein